VDGRWLQTLDPDEWRAALAGPRRLATAVEPGEPLAESDRAPLRPFVGELPLARVHRGPAAAAAAERIGADAFAVGQDVFLGGGATPGTPRGQAVLAHELVHVRQQADPGATVQRQEQREGDARLAEWAVLAAAGGRARPLTVGTYRPVYAAADGLALTPGEGARLDAIVARALGQAERLLGAVRTARVEIDRLELEVALDLSDLDDDAAVEQVGRAIADAVLAQVPPEAVLR
jgi:hypothetical protein